jgi:integrase/recombinase XerD
MGITYKLELNSKPKVDSTHGIMLRITENRKLKRISTGISVKEKDFNKNASEGKWIRKSNPKHLKLNTDLDEFIEDAKKAKKVLKNNNQTISKDKIASMLNEEDSKIHTDSFIEYWKAILPKIHNAKSVEFHRNCESKLNKLIKYLGEGKDLLFTELDTKFLNKYESYMKQKGNNLNTIATNLKMIRIVYNMALGISKKKRNLDLKNFNLINLNIISPFTEYSITEVPANKQKLTEKEVLALINLELEAYSDLWNVRNYFLFAMYNAGIRIRDLMQLKWNNIQGEFLSYGMSKNNKGQLIKLLPEALKILNEYKPKKLKQTDYIFPILNNNIQYDRDSLGKAIRSYTALINYKLKQLADMAEIEANLTTHISRHTFANIASQKGIDSYNLQKLLRHSSLKQTENYLEQLNNEAANKALEKFTIG